MPDRGAPQVRQSALPGELYGGSTQLQLYGKYVLNSRNSESDPRPWSRGRFWLGSGWGLVAKWHSNLITIKVEGPEPRVRNRGFLSGSGNRRSISVFRFVS